MTLGWFCCLAALVAVAAGSRQSDVYLVTPGSAPTVSWYIDNWEHYHSRVADEPYYTGGQYKTATLTFTHTIGGYNAYYYQNLPLNPGAVLGFSVPANSNNGLAAWIRTEWFQSFFSRSCTHNYYMSNSNNCTDRPVFHCATTTDTTTWLTPTSTAYKAMETAYLSERPVNPISGDWGTTQYKAFPLPLESYIIYPEPTTLTTAFYCRFTVPEPVFADMHVFPSTDDCYVEYKISHLMHPVEFLIGGDQKSLSLYPPVRFSYYGQMVNSMTMYTSGAVRFSDYDVNAKLNTTMSATSGAYIFFPSSTFDVNYLSQAPYIYPGYSNVTEPQYKASWPAWVFWNKWWIDGQHVFVGEDLYYNRYCTLSVFADRFDLGDWDTDDELNKMVYVYYGLGTDGSGKSVFVINYQNLGYYAAATPMSDVNRLHFQLQIYPDTQATSLMYLQYVNIGLPNERFRAKLSGVTYPAGTIIEATQNNNVGDFSWWAFGVNGVNDHDRFSYQMPVVGLRSCDGVWGGLYTESAGSLFPAHKCIRIMGCLNSYFDPTTASCTCAQRFTNFTASSTTDFSCMPCLSGTYKSVTGNFKCHSCPHYSTAPTALYGMDDNSECECDSYYGGNAAQKLSTFYHNDQLVTSMHPCEECAGDQDYKRHKGNEDCHCTDGCNTAETDETDIFADGWGQCDCMCGSYGHGFRATTQTDTPFTCKKCSNGPTNMRTSPNSYFKNYAGNCVGSTSTNCFSASCSQCPAPSSTQASLTAVGIIGVAGLATSDECGCQCVTYANYTIDSTKVNTATCVCRPGTYWPVPSGGFTTVVSSCTVCPNNTVKLSWANPNTWQTGCPTCGSLWTESYGLVQTQVSPFDHDGPEDCGCITGWGISGNGSLSAVGSWRCYKCGMLTDYTNSRPVLAHARCACESTKHAALNTDSYASAANEIQCVCAPGYYLSGSGATATCIDCPDNTYKSWNGNGACSPCGANANSNATTGKIHCACRNGGMYYINATESCAVCSGNTYLDPWNCATECAASGAMNCKITTAAAQGVRYHRMQSCLLCPYNSALNANATDGIQKHDSIDDCLCNAGFFQLSTHTACDTQPKVVCAECPEGTFQAVPNVLSSCRSCPSAYGYSQSAPRSDSMNDCLCPNGKFIDTTGICQNCPANTFMPQVTRSSACLSCPTGTTYVTSAAASQCIPLSQMPQKTNPFLFFDDATDDKIAYYNHNLAGVAGKTVGPRNSPAWFDEDFLHRAIYMRKKANFVTDNGDPTATSLTWTSIANNKLQYQKDPFYVTRDSSEYDGFYNAYWQRNYRMNNRGIGRGYYYDFVFNDMAGLSDFAYQINPSRVGHSLRVYLAGDEGIYVTAGHEDLVNQPHWSIAASNDTDNFYVFPYYCVNYYYMFDSAPKTKYYGAGAYLWDPAAPSVLSWAYSGTSLFLRIVADMRFTDTYVKGAEKVTIYVAVSHFSKHYMDVRVDGAISNTDQCQPRFIFREQIASTGLAGANATTWHFMDDFPFQYFHDYVYNNFYFPATKTVFSANRTSADLYNNYMIRFDFDLCFHCQCTDIDKSFLVFPTNWDINGCYCKNGCFVPDTANGNVCKPCTAANTYNTPFTNAYTTCSAPAAGHVVYGNKCAGTYCSSKDFSAQCCSEYGANQTTPKSWAWNTTNCITCPIDSYLKKNTVGLYICQACPGSSTVPKGTTTGSNTTVCKGQATGSQSFEGCWDISACKCPSTFMVPTVDGCRCARGYYHTTIDVCVACPSGTYKPSPSGASIANDLNNCVPCLKNTFALNTASPACTPCGWCKVTTGTGSKNASQCLCDRGCGFDVAKSGCWQCLPGFLHNRTSASVATAGKTEACLACRDTQATFDWYFSDGFETGSNTVTECGCNINYGFNVSNNKCYLCNTTAGQYKNFRGNSPCQACTYQKQYSSVPSKVGTLFTKLSATGNMAAISGGSPLEKLTCVAPMGAVLAKYVWLSDVSDGVYPRGTFKGEASFSRVSVYVRENNVIHFAIETDNDATANANVQGSSTWLGNQQDYRTDAAYKLCTRTGYDSDNVFYDLGIMFGYRIDNETLKVAVQTSTAASDSAAIVQVSFDFEGVYTSTTNMSNIIQFVVPMKHNSQPSQYALLNFVQFPAIATPVVVNWRDYHQKTTKTVEDQMFPPYTTNCAAFFNRFGTNDAGNVNYAKNPMLCRVHDSYYLDQYASSKMQFKIDFAPDQTCNPVSCASLHALEGVNAPVVGTYPNCRTCQTNSSSLQNTNGACTCIVPFSIPVSVAGVTACVCQAGYYYTPGSGISFTCTACTAPLIKENAGNTPSTSCLPCPDGSVFDNSIGLINSLSSCLCSANYTHIRLGVTGTTRADWCTKCPAYSRKEQHKPCAPGTDNSRANVEQCICSEWFASINSAWQCACNPGFYGNAQWANNYDTTTNSICNACPKNFYTKTEYVNGDKATRCLACDSTGIALTPYDAAWGPELCYCPTGYGGFPGATSTLYPNCAKCVGGVKNFDGTGVCSCNDANAIATPGTCQCIAGYEGDATSTNTTSNKCTQCKASFYKPGLGNSKCAACPANSYSNKTGGTSFKDCTCAANYWGMASNGTNCTLCYLGTKPAGNNMTCQCKSSAVRVNAQQCACAAGKGYDSTLDTCTTCALNSYKAGQNRNTCTKCPARSTTDSTGSVAQSDCICDAMYEPGTFTGSSDYCVACPTHYYKTQRGNFACTYGGSSFFFSGSTIPSTFSNPSNIHSGNAAGSNWPALAMLLVTLLAVALSL
eukprot:TRINITY_DN7906_c0_g1_i1.p1 TRINITY_DN7906_c0_g1~~TRINITY_DN7906_c0_g1_i1.p1  ORF type:complete len:2747 (-),score=408.01 TRINITY_DN7906_c0_g1_i1:175-8415(-)